ncbi:hypothetical protein LJC18_00045 [Lachnospiraceae bacterium OttesenSCG-928-E19]|nr:hypothetical protein [Lachnospiraceae bacterium OttesenSCG-928-E19]
MKKALTLSLLTGCAGLMLSNSAMAATPWWLQPTICRPNPNHCYTSMGAGYDTGMWDATGSCWGLKLICPNALTTNPNDAVPMGKNDLTARKNIKTDFDIGILVDDCFGSRKTAANGTMAAVDGKYVNVWCNGVLNNPDETLPNGEITYDTQPVCRDLAPDGFIAVVNQKCYGKFYDPSSYYIECSGSKVLPERIIQLNGANADIGTGLINPNYPTDTAAAKSLFDKMQSVSANQKKQYFEDI